MKIFVDSYDPSVKKFTCSSGVQIDLHGECPTMDYKDHRSISLLDDIKMYITKR